MDGALVSQTDMSATRYLDLGWSTRLAWLTGWLVLDLDMLSEMSPMLRTIGDLSSLGFLVACRACDCLLVLSVLLVFLDTKIMEELGARSRVSRPSQNRMSNAPMTWHPIIKGQIELSLSQGWLVARQPIHIIIQFFQPIEEWLNLHVIWLLGITDHANQLMLVVFRRVAREESLECLGEASQGFIFIRVSFIIFHDHLLPHSNQGNR
jgi:hypothetical protein